MSKKEKDYLRIEIRDFMYDEKLAECSASAVGIYVKIMCIMHKSETYGKILLKQMLKQMLKQKSDIIDGFAEILLKQMLYQKEEIRSALVELIDAKVLHLEGEYLVQQSMVNEFNMKQIRAMAGAMGGKKTQEKNKDFAKAFAKANPRARNSKYINKLFNIYLEREIGGVGEREKTKNELEEFSDENSKEIKIKNELENPNVKNPIEETQDNPLPQKPNISLNPEKTQVEACGFNVATSNKADMQSENNPKQANANSAPKTLHKSDDDMPDGIPIYLRTFEGYKTHLKAFFEEFAQNKPKAIRFMDEMCNRYNNLDFPKSLKMNVVDYWATEEAYQLKLKSAKLAVRKNKNKPYEIDWYKTMTNSLKFAGNRLYKKFDGQAKPQPSGLPHGFIDLNA